jgi:hypothetical protein
MHAARYTPAAWLGLSQLHTLRGVDLDEVSPAAIAAALPRLHTLTTFRHTDAHNPASAAGFFTDLLPQLRVFHFKGKWSVEASECPSPAPPPPLPLLEELVWDDPQPTVLRRFLGARPTLLKAPYDLIAECLTGARGGDTSGGEAASSNSCLLARVCMLVIACDTDPVVSDIDISTVARVLRAAPRMRTLAAFPRLCGDTSCLTASAAPLHPAFAGLIHPRLRQLYVNTTSDDVPQRDDSCASPLRRACFPHLQSVLVAGQQFFAS